MRRPAADGIQSVQSAFRVIEEMASIGDRVGVTALAARVGMPKVRVFRYLRTLQGLGYVRQDPATDKYELTSRLYELGQTMAEADDLLRMSRRALVMLSEATGLAAAHADRRAGARN